MATTQHTGTAYNTVAHWNNGIPTAGMNAVFPKSNTNEEITDTTAADGIDLAQLITMPGFVGHLGTTGDPIEGAAALFHIMGMGNVYWNCAKNGGDNQNCDEVRIECGNPKATIELGGQTDDAGEFVLVNHSSGNLLLKSGIAFAAAGLVNMQSEFAKLRTESGTATIPHFEQDGGRSFLNNIVTRLVLRSGVCIKSTNKASSITIGNGATLIYNHEAVTADVPRIVIYPGGTLDLMKNGVPKVFDEVIEWPGAKFLYTDSLHTITSHVRLRKSA